METSRINMGMDINNNMLKPKYNNVDKINQSVKIENNINNASNKIENSSSANNQNQNTKEEKHSKENVEKILKLINEQFKSFDREFSYNLHESTNRYIVTVKDAKTGDVIREIPSEESLDLFAKMLEMAGIFVDKKS